MNARRTTFVAVVAAISVTPVAAQADGARTDVEHARPARTVAVGFAAGVAMFDDHLADYRWDVAPAVVLGTHVLVYGDRFAGGVRLSRTRTVQASGIPGEEQAPTVNLTGLTAAGRARVASWKQVDLWGEVRAGALLLSYEPESITFSAGSIGAPITVAYDGVTELTLGAGVDARREFAGRVALGLGAAVETFEMDTAHRRGDEIVEARERFTNWDVQVSVSWLFGLD